MYQHNIDKYQNKNQIVSFNKNLLGVVKTAYPPRKEYMYVVISE